MEHEIDSTGKTDRKKREAPWERSTWLPTESAGFRRIPKGPRVISVQFLKMLETMI